MHPNYCRILHTVIVISPPKCRGMIAFYGASFNWHDVEYCPIVLPKDIGLQF